MKSTKKFFLCAWLVVVGLLVFWGTAATFKFIYNTCPQIHPFKSYYIPIVGLACCLMSIMAVYMHFHPGYGRISLVTKEELRRRKKELEWRKSGCSTSLAMEAKIKEQFTDRARKIMQIANQEAQRFKCEYVGTEFILLGLAKEGTGVAAHVLANLDVDLREICHYTKKIIPRGTNKSIQREFPMTPRAKNVIEYAMEEACKLNHNFVGSEHLLLSLLREEETVAAQVLMNFGVTYEKARKETLAMLGYGEADPT